MRKIAINYTYGGFHLSSKAILRLSEMGLKNVHPLGIGINRDDPILIQVIEELGDESSKIPGEIKIIQIPDHIDWAIKDYDGLEYIVEKHKSWKF